MKKQRRGNRSTQSKLPRFGQLEPQYNLALNPYPDARFYKCPNCEQKTRQRKLPLLIHVDPMHLIALNYTCRYCPNCDLLIAHQDQIEELLAALFAERDPSVIGNDYLMIGTVERQAWRENMKQPKPLAEMMAQTHDFKSHSTIQTTMAGWFREDQEPPLRQPPPPTVWVKQAGPELSIAHRAAFHSGQLSEMQSAGRHPTDEPATDDKQRTKRKRRRRRRK